jgi:hypothetical protein
VPLEKFVLIIIHSKIPRRLFAQGAVPVVHQGSCQEGYTPQMKES